MPKRKPLVIKVEYADDTVGPYTLYRDAPQIRGPLQLFPGQGTDGYGSKITTDILLRFTGEKQLRRVYATCYSNAASHWITYYGQTLHLRDHFQSDILPLPKPHGAPDHA